MKENSKIINTVLS